MDRRRLRQLLGQDQLALIDDLPTVIDVEPLRGRGPVTAHCLVLSDGSVFKVRRLASAEEAARVEVLLATLAHAAFPPVLRRHGAAILTAWVAGRPLLELGSQARLLTSCGALHAFVHERSPPEGLRYAASAPAPMAALERALAELVGAGWLGDEDARAVRKVAGDRAPDRCAIGIVHGDFNRENLVLDEAGGVGSVDNATLSIGPLAYDLARTWYRWPMDEGERAAYRAGYGRGAAALEFENHFPFWAVSVLARGAAFRLRQRHSGVAEPISRLRASVDRWI